MIEEDLLAVVALGSVWEVSEQMKPKTTRNTLSRYIGVPLVAVLLSTGCPSSFEPPWPQDMSSVLTTTISDAADDLEMGVSESPPYTVSFPQVDVTNVSFGVDGD